MQAPAADLRRPQLARIRTATQEESVDHLWTIRSKKLEHNPRCAKLLAGPARCLHKAGRQTLLRLVQANPSAQVGEIQKKIRAIATCAEADKA